MAFDPCFDCRGLLQVHMLYDSGLVLSSEETHICIPGQLSA